MCRGGVFVNSSSVRQSDAPENSSTRYAVTALILRAGCGWGRRRHKEVRHRSLRIFISSSAPALGPRPNRRLIHQLRKLGFDQVAARGMPGRHADLPEWHTGEPSPPAPGPAHQHGRPGPARRRRCPSSRCERWNTPRVVGGKDSAVTRRAAAEGPASTWAATEGLWIASTPFQHRRTHHRILLRGVSVGSP